MTKEDLQVSAQATQVVHEEDEESNEDKENKEVSESKEDMQWDQEYF